MSRNQAYRVTLGSGPMNGSSPRRAAPYHSGASSGSDLIGPIGKLQALRRDFCAMSAFHPIVALRLQR